MDVVKDKCLLGLGALSPSTCGAALFTKSSLYVSVKAGAELF